MTAKERVLFVRVTPELADRLETAAAARGWDVSMFVRDLLVQATAQPGETVTHSAPTAELTLHGMRPVSWAEAVEVSTNALADAEAKRAALADRDIDLDDRRTLAATELMTAVAGTSRRIASVLVAVVGDLERVDRALTRLNDLGVLTNEEVGRG